MKDPKRQISRSQPQNLNYTSDAQEVQAGESETTYVEREIRTLAKVTGLEPTKINLWKVAFEGLNNFRTCWKIRFTKARRKYAASRTRFSGFTKARRKYAASRTRFIKW
jgi:hypothetical protein